MKAKKMALKSCNEFDNESNNNKKRAKKYFSPKFFLSLLGALSAALLSASALPAFAADEAESSTVPETFEMAAESEVAPPVSPLFYGAAEPLRVTPRLWMEFANGEGADPFRFGLGYDFGNGSSVWGSYLRQDLYSESGQDAAHGDETPEAWNLAFNLEQNRLGLSGLRLEYARMGAGFRQFHGETANAPAWTLNGFARNYYYPEDTDVFFMGTQQNWGRRWSTFQSYARYESQNLSVASQWGVGVGFSYSPGLKMELTYSDQDGALENESYRNRQVRLRAMIAF